jgi:hypothetical protein
MSIPGGRDVEVEVDTSHERAWKRARLEDPKDPVMENGNRVFVANGTPALPKYVGKKQRFSVEELIRLMNQQLRHLGFIDIAENLERRSKVKLELPEVSRLRESVQSGNWDAAVAHLRQLPLKEGLRDKAAFIILQNKYLEVLRPVLRKSPVLVAVYWLSSEMLP